MEDYEQLKSGDVLSDRYVLERHLGQGGMGTVWLALDQELDELPVAVKLLRPEYTGDSQFLATFKSEAKSSMKLTHAQIVRLFSFIRDDKKNLTYLVLKYINGQTMKEALADSPQGLPVDRVMAWAEKLASALDYAHSNGVLHRDLKPSNVMIDQSTDTPLLMDFGISKQMDQTLAIRNPGTSIGTPAYMSPQALHNKDSAANDIYSFSAMLYEALCGRPPFSGADIQEQILRVAAKPIPGVPDAVNSAILAGLAKNETDRPASAAKLVQLMNDGPMAPTASHKHTNGALENPSTAGRANQPVTQPAGSGTATVIALAVVAIVGLGAGAMPRVSGPIQSLMWNKTSDQTGIGTTDSDRGLGSDNGVQTATGEKKGLLVVPPTYNGDPNGLVDQIPALIFYTMKDNPDTVRLILDHPEVNVNGLDPRTGYTALHMAAEVGAVSIIPMLIEAQIDVNVLSKDGLDQTPLHVAAKHDRHRAAQALIDKAANASALDVGQNTPMHVAVESGSASVVGVLIRANGDINARNMRQQTPLHLAAKKGDASVIRTLLEAGADPSTTNKKGKKPLELLPANTPTDVQALFAAP